MRRVGGLVVTALLAVVGVAGRLEALGSATSDTGDAAEVGAGTEIQATVTDRGERLRVKELALDPSDLVAQLAGDIKAIQPVASEFDLPAPDVRLQLFDGVEVLLDGTEVSVTTVPLFNEHLLVEDWGQVVAWRSSTSSAKAAPAATLTLARTVNTDWQLVAGTLEVPQGEFIISSDSKHPLATLSQAPVDSPDEDDTLAPPKIEGQQAFRVERQLAGGSDAAAGFLPAASPPIGSYLDVMGVVSAGMTLVDGFFYLAGGFNNLEETFDNSSSLGYETARVNVHFVGVVANSYVQSGDSITDLFNLAGGVGSLSSVLTARNLLGADTVTMVAPQKLDGSTCGIAVPPGYPGYENAFTVVTVETNPDCEHRLAIPHEVGHNLGASHQNWADPYYSDSLAYPAGAVADALPCTVVHTNTGCRRLVYSSPYVNFPSSTTPAGVTGRFNAKAVSTIVIDAVNFRSPVVQGGGNYTALTTPQRILDSRPATSTGGYNTPWAANVGRPVSIAGNASIPEGATSAVVNITVAQPATSGTLQAWAWGIAPSTATTASFITGKNKATTAIVAIGTYGMIEVKTTAATHVIIDVLGYFGGNSSATAKYAPITPVRAYDTRVAPLAGFAAGETRTINLSTLTSGAVPTSAVAAIINVTATNAGANGWLTLAPSSTSILNYYPSTPIANLAFAPLSAGQITIYSQSATHVIVDVLGFVGPTGTLLYTPIVPNRRVTAQPVAAGGTWDVTVTGTTVGIPTTAQAVVLNLSAQNASATTWMVAYDKGGAAPAGISHLNVTTAGPNNNTALAKPGTGGQVRVYNDTALAYLNVDLVGYFS